MDSYKYAVFQRLYSNYAPALLGIISRLVGERAIAEKILQETMIQLFSNPYQQQLQKEPGFSCMRQLAIANAKTYLSEKIDQVKLTSNSSDQDLFELVYFKGYSEKQLLLELGLTSTPFRKRLRNSILALRINQGNSSV